MEAAHIKDVISALRVVNNHYDEIGWMRFLTFWDGIGEVKAGKYISQLLQYEDPLECAKNLSDIIGGQEGETISDVYNSIYITLILNIFTLHNKVYLSIFPKSSLCDIT